MEIKIKAGKAPVKGLFLLQRNTLALQKTVPAVTAHLDAKIQASPALAKEKEKEKADKKAMGVLRQMLKDTQGKE